MPKKIIEVDLSTRVILTVEESDPDGADNRTITATDREVGPATDEALVNRLVELFGPYTVFEITGGTDRRLQDVFNEVSNRIPGSNTVSTVQVSAVPGGDEGRFQRRVSPADLATIRAARGASVVEGVAQPSDAALLNLAVQNSEVADRRRPWQRDRATENNPPGYWIRRVP